jgi:ubiquinone/menaquinone biosynthesis C-methylase UbiE
VDFDDFAAGYEQTLDEAVAFSGQPLAFFLDAKARHLAAASRARLGEAANWRVLEVGCGTGLMRRRLGPLLGPVWGIDASLGCLAEAARAGERTRLAAADCRRLPFASGSFDLVLAICMLHHVAEAARDAALAEMVRLTRSGGLVAIWEHNPWNPLTRRLVAQCPFDRDAVLLSRAETKRRMRRAGLSRIDSHHCLFFPWRGRLWQGAERLLAQVPLGAQFVVYGMKS